MPTYRLWDGSGVLRATYTKINHVAYQGHGSRIVLLYRGHMGNPLDATELCTILCLGDNSRLELANNE